MQHTGFPNIATPPGSTAYYVARFSKPQWRDNLACIFLWKHELTKLYAMSDPGVARIKLQWWIEQINLPIETPSSHDLARQLTTLCAQHDSLMDAIHSIGSVTDQHLHRRGYQTIDNLWEGCIDFGGGFAKLINAVSSNISNEKEILIGALIIAIEWLQMMGQYIRNNINLIPQSLMNKYEIKFDQLLHQDKQAHARALLKNLFRQIESQASFPEPLRSSAPLHKYYRLRKKMLDLLISEEFDVLDQKISLTPIRKLWLAL
jgi:phytoene synthase